MTVPPLQVAHRVIRFLLMTQSRIEPSNWSVQFSQACSSQGVYLQYEAQRIT